MLEGVTFGEGFSYAGGRVRALGPTGALHIWREALAEPRTLALELGFTPAERFNGYPLKLSVRCGEQTLAETWYRAREVQQLRLALPAATTDLCVQFISQPTVPAGNRVPGVPGEAFQVHGCRWLPAGQAGPPQPARAPLAAPAAPRLAGPPPGATEVAVLAKQAAAFRAVLLAHKHALNPEPNFWYRYDTLAGLNSLDKLLTGPHRDLAALAAGRPIADIGAADGDLAFFLESVGLRCHVIDNAGTNHNGLRGARLMKAALGSAVDIYDLNLDQRFDWPTEPVGLALFLGLLYHLKNPYYALETLAQHAHYCVLSTKVAAYLPGGETLIRAAPVAYLLDELECNGDPTNFWIFSESGLERLAQRTGWEMLNLITVGSPRSDPASLTNDQRAFCLLRSQRRASRPRRWPRRQWGRRRPRARCRKSPLWW